MLASSNNPDDIERANAIGNLEGFTGKPLTLKKIQELIDRYFPE